jgi:hypothetical protein
LTIFLDAAASAMRLAVHLPTTVQFSS